MPRTKKIDDAPVVALYAEIGNARAVARQLNMHHQTVNQILRRHQGLCLRCRAPVLPGRKQCDACDQFDRDRIAARRKTRLRHGLCTECDNPVQPPSRSLCAGHRLAAIDREAAYDKNKSRGSTGEAPSLDQKLSTIRNSYGDGAVRCFTEADGRCEVCAVHYTDAALHLHHLDEDRGNNDRSNFACLCWRCHRTVHLLIDAVNRERLVGWFRRTYPDKPID